MIEARSCNCWHDAKVLRGPLGLKWDAAGMPELQRLLVLACQHEGLWLLAAVTKLHLQTSRVLIAEHSPVHLSQRQKLQRGLRCCHALQSLWRVAAEVDPGLHWSYPHHAQPLAEQAQEDTSAGGRVTQMVVRSGGDVQPSHAAAAAVAALQRTDGAGWAVPELG